MKPCNCDKSFQFKGKKQWMGEAGNKTKPPHAFESPTLIWQKTGCKHHRGCCRGNLRHPPLHSHCLRLLGKARATRVTPHDQNVNLYGKRGVNHTLWSMGHYHDRSGQEPTPASFAHTSYDFFFFYDFSFFPPHQQPFSWFLGPCYKYMLLFLLCVM